MQKVLHFSYDNVLVIDVGINRLSKNGMMMIIIMTMRRRKCSVTNAVNAMFATSKYVKSTGRNNIMCLSLCNMFVQITFQDSITILSQYI